MLIVEVKDADSLDKALKKYKRKVDQTGLLKQVRQRKHFTKPSVERREEILKAQYVNQKQLEE